MNRRTVLTALWAIAVTSPVEAQRLATIGVLTFGVESSSPYLAAFRQGLREHGHVEGKTVVIEVRYAQGRAERLPAMAAELARLPVDVLVTESTPAALAASKATKTIPIVMAAGTNPVTAGLAASLARPGGNFTGITVSGADRAAKQLQLLKESVPEAVNIAVIHNPIRQGIEDELREAAQSARSLGVTLQLVTASNPAELNSALEALGKSRPSAFITIADGMLHGNSKRIADFALRNQLPAVFPVREFAEAGGLMAYGPDIGFNFRRAAAFVDKILRGAKPGELPIEQPTKWGLVVNLRTAKALGLKIPGTVLVRADEVLQ